LHPHANGLVITAQDGTTVKASSVGRDFSKPKLEQRFGSFQPAPEQETTLKPQRRYEKKPLGLRPDTAKLYAQYQAAQAQVATIRARERERVRARKEKRIEAAMRHVRLKRAALKLATMPRAAKKLMYGAIANALLDEIPEIKRASEQEYQDTSRKCRRRQWVDWLRHQAGTGNADALAALRRRKPTRDVADDSINGNGQLRPPSPGRRHDGVTKRGTIIYRVGASAVRDEGDTLRVSRGAEQDAIQAALRMALERFGKTITINGSDAFKEQIVIAAAATNLPIVFDDPALEQRRLQHVSPSTAQSNAGSNIRTRPPAHKVNDGLGLVSTATTVVSNLTGPPKTQSTGHTRARR
jgi:hypothetical protein